jgi:hypothetical protein
MSPSDLHTITNAIGELSGQLQAYQETLNHRIMRLDHTVYGNGKAGLVERIGHIERDSERVEKAKESAKKSMISAAGSFVTAAVGIIWSLLKG